MGYAMVAGIALLLAGWPAAAAALCSISPQYLGGQWVAPIVLQDAAGNGVAGLQFEASSPEGAAWITRVRPGPVAIKAGKQAGFAARGAQVRVVLSGVNQQILSDGGVAVIYFDSPPGHRPRGLVLSNVLLTNAAGEAVRFAETEGEGEGETVAEGERRPPREEPEPENPENHGEPPEPVAGTGDGHLAPGSGVLGGEAPHPAGRSVTPQREIVVSQFIDSVRQPSQGVSAGRGALRHPEPDARLRAMRRFITARNTDRIRGGLLPHPRAQNAGSELDPPDSLTALLESVRKEAQAASAGRNAATAAAGSTPGGEAVPAEFPLLAESTPAIAEAGHGLLSSAGAAGPFSGAAAPGVLPPAAAQAGDTDPVPWAVVLGAIAVLFLVGLGPARQSVLRRLIHG